MPVTAAPAAPDVHKSPMESPHEEMARHMWRNSISNYLAMGLRMALGVVMFGVLKQGLHTEEFGFWTLLWSVFGFGILLDFGFGFTAVKKVAELSVHQNWTELSQVLSTIFYLYVVIALIIVGIAFGFSHALIGMFNISPPNREIFRQIMVLFFCGIGIGFPLGIFPEILIGQQRIFLANMIFSVTGVLNFVFITVAIRQHLGLRTIVIISLASAIVPSALCGACALKKLPHVKLLPKYFSPKMIVETLRFSVFTYISTLSNMILGKTDRLVIGIVQAVSSVALYETGAKVGEVFGTFTNQLPDTFSPAAAHLHAKGEKEVLRRLLLDGTRFSVMIATPAFLIGLFYMQGMIAFLSRDRTFYFETFWVGEILLTWQFVTLLTQSVTKRIFMMCGHERKLMWMGLGEALLNLVLSVSLIVKFHNVIGVALGSLIATMVFGFGYILPWAAKEAELSLMGMLRKVLFPTLRGCLPLVAYLLLTFYSPWLDYRKSSIIMIGQCVLGMFIGFIGLWNYAMTTSDRFQVARKFPRIFKAGKTA
ncbi:MAG: hypothetical protein JWN25_2887 [Verrucomicrobiales bacterium]|nr:hypothetical protein [Verrucomicrobiales bacterium]